MLDFRAAYLPNKYWGRGSVVVPSKPVILDERFKTLNDLYLDQHRRNSFDIYWLEQNVMGNVTLPGELNYAYINGKYYHLEKVINQGLFNNGGHVENEWSYYLEYDDWQNDWLTNKVHIEGTISKTGNYELARSNIVQLAPLITGCNNYKFFISGEEEDNRREVVNDVYRQERYIYCPRDINEFNKRLTGIISQTMETSERTRLRIPLVLKPCRIVDPTSVLLDKVSEFLKRPDLKVFDVKKNVINFNSFKTKNKLKQVYCITTKEYHTFEIAESENQHARVKNRIDFLKYGMEIEHLNTDLTPLDDSRDQTLDGLVEKYLKRYPNITSTRDKGEFKYIAYEEIFTILGSLLIPELPNESTNITTFDENFLNGKPKWIINDYHNFKTELKEYKGLELLPSERLLSINGIYQPGTDPNDIFVVDDLRKPDNLNYGKKYEINNKYPSKTPPAWYASKTFEELKEWLYFLNDDNFLSLNSFKLENTGDKLKGNLLVKNLIYERYNKTPTIVLLPDYRSRGWVLGELLSYPQNNLYKIFTTDGEDEIISGWISFIQEIGLIDANRQTTWLHPQTDTILNNDNKRWSKYAFIIPLMIRWNRGYDWAYDSYGYKFFYEFTEQRWKGVKESGSSSYESKRFNLVFQFPLSGCGFDIYEILKEYKDLNDKYLRWNFICSNEYKTKMKWTNKGGEFEDFFDIAANSNNEPISIEGKTVNNHLAFNEAIEIRIYSRAGSSINRVMQLIFKLWVYFFGWRWDGSYNGAVLFTNHGSEKGSGFAKIMWAKPFNRRWYMCGVWINNYYGSNLSSSERQSNGYLLYGKGSPTWDPKKEVWAIGYQYAKSLKGSNVDDIKDVLTSNVKTIRMRTNTDEYYEDINTFESSNIEPVKFSHLFLGDKPWENIKYVLGKPKEEPFANFSLGKRLKDVVRNMTYSTNRTINPKFFNPWLYKPIDNIKIIQSGEEIEESYIKDIDFNYSIPFYIFNVLNPDNILSKFKHINFTGSVEDSKNHFRTTLQSELHNALTLLSSRPFIFDIKGSEFIAIAKINVTGEMELELISKSNASIETVEAKHYTFTNPMVTVDTFENFVQRVSSQFELVVFGQRIPLKTRPDTTLDNIDIGLKITPINDPKQSTTSLWYMVEIKTDQDTQRTRIEVPKELNAMNIQTAYEREHIIRTMAYHSKDRYLESLQQKDEISKYSFDIDLKGQRMDIGRKKEITDEIVGMAQTSLQMAQGVAMGGIFSVGGAMSFMAGGAALAGQAMNMVYSKELHNLNKQEHIYHAALGERSLNRRSDLMRNKHELAEQADRLKLYNMQTNINYPANSDALMFREENKQMNLTDVYLTQYYPEGQLLEFLTNYYKEYGFNIVVPNQKCFGVDWIKRHIQFVKITNNVHESETVRRMIEERALRGITLEDNTDWHADRVRDLTNDFKHHAN